MLEILLLIWLTNKIGKIADERGHRSGPYKLMTVLFWFGGEFLGAAIGASLSGTSLVTYGIAILGAAAGAIIANWIAKGLKAGRNSAVPFLVLGLAWIFIYFLDGGWGTLITGIFSVNTWTNMGWFVFWTLRLLLVGFLQWLVLIIIIPKSERKWLGLWIPAGLAGYFLQFAYGLLNIPSEPIGILVSILFALVTGVLQWLILRRYSPRAFWWLPAVFIDSLAANFLFGPIMLGKNFPFQFQLYILTTCIASSVAIVFILRNYLLTKKPEPVIPQAAVAEEPAATLTSP
jgi:hypothetical protein